MTWTVDYSLKHFLNGKTHSNQLSHNLSLVTNVSVKQSSLQKFFITLCCVTDHTKFSFSGRGYPLQNIKLRTQRNYIGGHILTSQILDCRRNVTWVTSCKWRWDQENFFIRVLETWYQSRIGQRKLQRILNTWVSLCLIKLFQSSFMLHWRVYEVRQNTSFSIHCNNQTYEAQRVLVKEVVNELLHQWLRCFKSRRSKICIVHGLWHINNDSQISDHSFLLRLACSWVERINVILLFYLSLMFTLLTLSLHDGISVRSVGLPSIVMLTHL